MAPASYAPARMMVPFLVVALVLQLLSSMANAGCYARATSNVTMAVTGTAAAVTLALYLLLIPRFGVNGAIGATVVGQAVRLAVFAVISQRTVPLGWPLGRLTLIAIAACGTGAAPLLGSVALGWAGLILTTTIAMPVILGRLDIAGMVRDVARILRRQDATAPRRSLVNA